MKAFKAYKTALEKNAAMNSPKKYEAVDALKGLQEVQGHLYNFGIYARKDDLPISNEFKARLEKVQAGGRNDSSFFN